MLSLSYTLVCMKKRDCWSMLCGTRPYLHDLSWSCKPVYFNKQVYGDVTVEGVVTLIGFKLWGSWRWFGHLRRQKLRVLSTTARWIFGRDSAPISVMVYVSFGKSCMLFCHRAYALKYMPWEICLQYSCVSNLVVHGALIPWRYCTLILKLTRFKL